MSRAPTAAALLIMLTLAGCGGTKGGPWGGGWGDAGPLHKAAWERDANSIRAAAARGADPNAAATITSIRWKPMLMRQVHDTQVVVPLSLALERQAVEAVHALLEVGADPKPDRLTYSDYHYMVHMGEPTIRAALDAGLPVDADTGNGLTLLHRVVVREDVAAVKLLLARGADPNARDRRGRTPLIADWQYVPPIGSNAGAEVVRVMVAAGADPAAEATPFYVSRHPDVWHTPTALTEAREARREEIIAALESALAAK